jgi:hypothetical protein
MRLFESRMLRRVLDLKSWQQKEDRENYLVYSFTFTVHQINERHQIHGIEWDMKHAWRSEKCIQNFGRETFSNVTTWEYWRIWEDNPKAALEYHQSLG